MSFWQLGTVQDTLTLSAVKRVWSFTGCTLSVNDDCTPHTKQEKSYKWSVVVHPEVLKATCSLRWSCPLPIAAYVRVTATRRERHLSFFDSADAGCIACMFYACNCCCIVHMSVHANVCSHAIHWLNIYKMHAQNLFSYIFVSMNYIYYFTALLRLMTCFIYNTRFNWCPLIISNKSNDIYFEYPYIIFIYNIH